MNTDNLPLFSIPSNNSKTVTPQITEEKIVAPLAEVLKTTPISTHPSQSLTKSLDDLFPEQAHEEKAMKRAKEVLGSVGETLIDEQLRDIVSEVQFLVTTWLDDFEKSIFKGLTLRELLHERGGT